MLLKESLVVVEIAFSAEEGRTEVSEEGGCVVSILCCEDLFNLSEELVCIIVALCHILCVVEVFG